MKMSSPDRNQDSPFQRVAARAERQLQGEATPYGGPLGGIEEEKISLPQIFIALGIVGVVLAAEVVKEVIRRSSQGVRKGVSVILGTNQRLQG